MNKRNAVLDLLDSSKDQEYVPAGFFLHFDEFWSPNFLMGEEFFLSKQLESKGFQFFYYPGIVVHHHDHATVSKIPSKKLWIYSREYHRIYRKFVSPYRIKMDNARNFNEIK